jgi:pyruvate dehydrogenase E2 component (dihydrolipoamide acetyltransferase)
MRRAIGKSMSASALIPQFTIERDARLEALAAWRSEASLEGAAITYSDAIVAATARALRDHPGLNASYTDEAILQHEAINIGFAFDLPDGLIAPAIRRADELSLYDLRAERERLATAARNGSLTPDDVFAATFTVSNLGPLGVRRFRALVVPPQASILALGSVTEDRLMSLSLSCDHRVVDGAPAARFLSDLVGLLEEPEWLGELGASP